MKTALIVTLGFDEKFCYRAILRHGIKEGNKIILLTAGLVERVKKAYEWIKAFAERSYDVEVKIVQIDVRDFTKAIKVIAGLFEEHRDFKLIINLSGGMRALSIIVLLAFLIKPIRNADIEIELEDFSGVVNIRNEIIDLIVQSKNLTEERLKVLRTITKYDLSDVGRLAEVMGKDVTTVRRHIHELSKLGLVKIVKRKPMVVKASELAELIL